MSSRIILACVCFFRYMRDSVLQLTKIEFAPTEAIVLDYFVSAFWWAVSEQKFSKEQISAFYTIVQTLLDNIRGTLVLDRYRAAAVEYAV